MPFIDIFFWIVLIIRIAIIVAVFVALDMMLGHIAYKQGIPGRRGTKNKTLKTSADCSLTFYVQTVER